MKVCIVGTPLDIIAASEKHRVWFRLKNAMPLARAMSRPRCLDGRPTEKTPVWITKEQVANTGLLGLSLTTRAEKPR